MNSTNLFLNNAIYGRGALELNQIIRMIESVKQNTEKILTVCQSQETYAPWEKADYRKGKKPQASKVQNTDLKRRCQIATD